MTAALVVPLAALGFNRASNPTGGSSRRLVVARRAADAERPPARLVAFAALVALAAFWGELLSSSPLAAVSVRDFALAAFEQELLDLRGSDRSPAAARRLGAGSLGSEGGSAPSPRGGFVALAWRSGV